MKIKLFHLLNRGKRRTAVVFFLLLFLFFDIAKGEEIGIREALDLFYKNNYDIVKNQYEIDKASADLLEAKLRLNPSLSVDTTGFVISKGGIRSIDNTQLAVRVDQPIRVGKKKELKIASAKENFEAVKLSYKDIIRNILSVFYTVYYGISLDKLYIDFSRGELARFEKTLEIAEKRYTTGFLSINDYTKLKLQRIELENNLINYETKFLNGIENFNLILGSKERFETVGIVAQESFQEYTEDDLIEKAYKNRPDFLSIRKQIKASEYNLSLAKANRLPDVTVGVEYDSFAPDYKPGIGAGVSLPLPLFNRNQGEIKRRDAERSQVKVEAEKIQRQIVADVRQALSSYRGFVKIFESYKSKKEEMEKLLENNEKAFSLGGVTALELIDTRRTYIDFMTKYNQAMVQAMLGGELLKIYTGEIK